MTGQLCLSGTLENASLHSLLEMVAKVLSSEQMKKYKSCLHCLLSLNTEYSENWPARLTKASVSQHTSFLQNLQLQAG